MKYYFDTEFIEGTQKKIFGHTKPTIDLISIGIVAEDEREYCAISKDFNLKEAWSRYQMKQVYGDARNRFPEGVKEYWLRENVLKPIFLEFYPDNLGNLHHYPSFTYRNMKQVIKNSGKTNKQIAKDIIQFVYPDLLPMQDTEIQLTGTLPLNFIPKELPELYAYYADYDWVVFCWLFGNMINLPKGFPMYCRDLKQTLDERANKLDMGKDIDAKVNYIKSMGKYPKQTNEHNALADARWNKQLHHFLQNV